MDFNQLFSDRERQLIQKVLNGTAVALYHNWYSEQTHYLFKFQDKFYRYNDDGKFEDDLELSEYQNGPGLIREIVGMCISDGIKEMDVGTCLQKGKMTEFMSRRVYYRGEDDYYYWDDRDEQERCHKISTKDLVSYIIDSGEKELLQYQIRNIDQDELNQVEARV